MKRGQKIVLVIGVAIVGVAAVGAVAWVAYVLLHTLRHIPEAYAAWDTGTLLTEYMRQHNDQWPRSWDDLLTVMDSDEGRQIPLRGSQAGDVAYARSLRGKVSVDWHFDPSSPGVGNPVTTREGEKFSVLWAGADPNEMVRSYLAEHASTRPSAAH